jgi:hypothetical protein
MKINNKIFINNKREKLKMNQTEEEKKEAYQ